MVTCGCHYMWHSLHALHTAVTGDITACHYTWHSLCSLNTCSALLLHATFTACTARVHCHYMWPSLHALHAWVHCRYSWHSLHDITRDIHCAHRTHAAHCCYTWHSLRAVHVFTAVTCDHHCTHCTHECIAVTADIHCMTLHVTFTALTAHMQCTAVTCDINCMPLHMTFTVLTTHMQCTAVTRDIHCVPLQVTFTACTARIHCRYMWPSLHALHAWCRAPSCGRLKQVVIKSQYSKAFSVKILSCLLTKCWWCLCHTICLTEKRVCGRAGHDTAQGMSIFQPICFLNLLPRFLFSVCFIIWRRKAREKHDF